MQVWRWLVDAETNLRTARLVREKEREVDSAGQQQGELLLRLASLGR